MTVFPISPFLPRIGVMDLQSSKIFPPTLFEITKFKLKFAALCCNRSGLKFFNTNSMELILIIEQSFTSLHRVLVEEGADVIHKMAKDGFLHLSFRLPRKDADKITHFHIKNFKYELNGTNFSYKTIS